MTDPNSPIIGNYPLNFRIDQEGKRNDWEGVVCIPFIDVQLLLQAARSIDIAALSQVERDRNSHGHILLFSHDKSNFLATPGALWLAPLPPSSPVVAMQIACQSFGNCLRSTGMALSELLA